MNREQKAALVEELAEQIRSADAIFAVDYRGISVSEVADLRARLREADTRFRIVKNSMTERAADAAGEESLKPMLEGPTALAFVGGDAALAAKALNDMARALDTLAFKGGLMDGATLSPDEIKAIARLPARDVLHGQLVGTIAAPLSGLVRTLNAMISGLAIQLKQVADQGLVSGEAPSDSEAPRAPDTDGEAEASGASASDSDGATPETEAATSTEQPEAEAEAETKEPEAQADAESGEPEPEAAADEPAGEEPAAAEPAAEAEASSDSTGDTDKADKSEKDASDDEAEASKED